MTSIEEFYFRYYATRLLREGYINRSEYQALLSANRLCGGAQEKLTNAEPSQFR